MRSMLPRGAVQPMCRQNMVFDQRVDGGQGNSGMADQIGQCGQADLDAFTGKALCLAVQRLVLAELFKHDHGDQAGACPTAWNGMERCWRLADLFA